MTADGRTTVRKPTTRPSRSQTRPGLRAHGVGAFVDPLLQAEPVGQARDDRVALGGVVRIERADPVCHVQRSASLQDAGTREPRSIRSTENRSSLRSTVVASSKLIHSSPGLRAARAGRVAPRASRRPAPPDGNSPDTAAPRTSGPVQAASVSHVPTAAAGFANRPKAPVPQRATDRAGPSARSPRRSSRPSSSAPRARRSGARSRAPRRSPPASAGRPRRRPATCRARVVPMSLPSIRSRGRPVSAARRGPPPVHSRSDERLHGAPQGDRRARERGTGVPLTSRASARAPPSLQEQAADPSLWDDPAEGSPHHLRALAAERRASTVSTDLQRKLDDAIAIDELLSDADDPDLASELASYRRRRSSGRPRRPARLRRCSAGPYDATTRSRRSRPAPAGPSRMDWADMLLRMFFRWAERRSVRRRARRGPLRRGGGHQVGDVHRARAQRLRVAVGRARRPPARPDQPVRRAEAAPDVRSRRST